MSEHTRKSGLSDYYFELLRNLNADIKLDLISRLSQSLKKTGKEQEASLDSLYGAYKSDESAEEIIDALRAARTFNRNTEQL